jgi:hypothetical protein
MAKLCITLMVTLIFLLRPAHAAAQGAIAQVIKDAVVKVIKAVDLKIQRLQNKTIWLQNAQKAVENEMSRLRLGEIKDWEEKQRNIYRDYFDELWKVKAALTNYHKVKTIIGSQVQLVQEYKSACRLLFTDKNFTVSEIEYMQRVYEGIVTETSKNVDQLLTIISSYSTQMDDAGRWEIIGTIAQATEQNLSDLRAFTGQNKRLSLQRSADKKQIDETRKIHGLNF